MEKTLSELIREYKDGGKRNFEKIAEKMNPLIEFYARKLYTWDREDARQEMLLALFLSLEKMKERYQSPEYIPVTFDMETQMVAESPNLYIANLPKEPQESKDFIRCISLDKTAVSISEDGKRLQAYLKQSETSEVREIDLEGKELRKYSKKNEDIAAECLKYQRSRGRERQPVPEEILRHKPDVNLKKR